MGAQAVRVVAPDPRDRELVFALRGVEGVEVVGVTASGLAACVEVLVGEEALRARLPGAGAMELWQGSVVPTAMGWAIPTYDPAWVMDKAQWPLRWLLGAHVGQAVALGARFAAQMPQMPQTPQETPPQMSQETPRVPGERSEPAHRPADRLTERPSGGGAGGGAVRTEGREASLVGADGAISGGAEARPFVLPRRVHAHEWVAPQGASMLALDVETDASGRIDLLGMSWDGVNVWQAHDLNYNRVIIQTALDAADMLIAHNAAFDTRALEAAGFGVPRERMFDSIVAQNMLWSDLDVGLNDSIAVTLAGEWTFHKALWGFSKEWAREREVCRRVWAHWMRGEWQDNDSYVFDFYNRCDVAAQWRLFARQRQLLEAR